MKYSQEQIKEKAIQFLDGMDSGDHRCGLLLMMLSMATSTPEDECLKKIKEFAQQNT